MTDFPELRAKIEQAAVLLDVQSFDDPDELLRIWDQVDEIAKTAATLAREISTAAAKLIGSGRTYESVIGTVHTAARASTKTDGNAILHALSTTMIDPQTGEQMEAIPTDVLLDVLPAVQPGQTSSKWKKEGLKNLDIDPDDFMQTTYSRSQVNRGPRRT